MRLIDADALMDYCNNLKDKTIDANDIARFPTAIGWISVKDRLPAQQGKYLVNVIQYCCGKFDITWFDGKVWTAPDGEEYTDNFSNNDNRIGKVTHWMPLPEPPKEDKGDD